MVRSLTVTQVDGPAVVRARAEVVPGATLGRYIILQRIGAGGMGVVYAAFDCGLERKVALKLVGDERSERAQARLLREARAMAKLAHPNVIAVHDVGTIGHRVYVAMELVDGGTLTEWLLAKPRRWPEIVDKFAQAARGLAAAHAAGLVHRDFKPDNVLIGTDGRARVTDFGIACASDLEVDAADDDEVGAEATTVRAFAGTPLYMAPELLAGAAYDARADQFSLCVALYQALYGMTPFAGTTPAELQEAIGRGVVIPEAANRAIPGPVRHAVLRGLAERPSDRFATLDQLIDVLVAAPAARRRKFVAASALLSLAVVGTLGYRSASAAVEPKLCSGARDRLAGVWDQPRKQRIESAFAATGVPYAADTWRAVETRLDAYTAAWAEMRTAACEATNVRGEQSPALLDLRMDCLDQRLVYTKSLVDQLARGGKDAVDAALDAAFTLPAIESCADTDLLTAVVPLPADPTTRTAVADLRERLANAKALVETRKLDAALELAGPLEAEAARIGYRPLEAETLLLIGGLHDAKDPAIAEAKLFAAVTAAEAGHDDATAIKALSGLIEVVGLRQGKFSDAERWAQLATARVERVAKASELEVTVLGARWLLYLGAANRQAMVETARRILTLRTSLYGADDPRTAKALSTLGTSLSTVGDLEGARQYQADAAAILERALGRNHRDVGHALRNLAVTMSGLDRYDEAVSQLRRSIEIMTVAVGAQNPDLIPSYANLAVALADLGRCDESTKISDDAIAIATNAYGANHPQLVMILATEANNLNKCRRHADAARVAKRGLAIVEATPSPPSMLARMLTELGEAELGLGNPRAAIAALERALRLNDDSWKPTTKFALARTLAALHRDPSRARELATEARDGFAKFGDMTKNQRIAVDVWLAQQR
ncbi:MAG: protein kinase [Kofleriaceae bacterium]